MIRTLKYVKDTLGIQLAAIPLAKSYLDSLPLYIIDTFKLYRSEIFKTEIIFAELKNNDELSVLKIEKQAKQLTNLLNQKVVVILENVQAYSRKRLIEKGINFIVPSKQLFLPELLVDLRETYVQPRTKQAKEKLLPSAQFLLIYHITHRSQDWNIQEHSFKEIAEKLSYTPMAITNAIDNLKYHELLDVVGEKEKFIRFRFEQHELWNAAMERGLLVNPVIKTVFVDEMPKDLFLLLSNESGLAEYTDLNPSKQEYYAIEKNVFYELQKKNELVNPNENEGKYALEVWKYNPLNLLSERPNSDMSVLDPFSLYLSLKDRRDERIEIARDQIIEKFIW